MKRRVVARTGARSVTGSDQARRLGAWLLRSLSGACGPLDAARGMGVALARYYQLEARVLQAMVAALEPRPRGRQVHSEARERKSQQERQRLERDLHRYQALYRTLQKTMGVPPELPARAEEKAGGKKRRLRRVTRGERVAKVLDKAQVPQVVHSPSPSEGSSGP